MMIAMLPFHNSECREFFGNDKKIGDYENHFTRCYSIPDQAHGLDDCCHQSIFSRMLILNFTFGLYVEK